MAQEYKIVHYEKKGHDIFQEWLDDLRDTQGKDAINRTLKKVSNGNFGDHKFCRDGVYELRIHIGYRVYYSIIENVVVLLLCGGSKSTQQRDIDKAVEYLQNFKKEN